VGDQPATSAAQQYRLRTTLARFIQGEQDQIPNALRIALARTGNLNNHSRHDFRYGVGPIEQLKGCANTFKGGRHGLNRLGIKIGSF